MELVNFYEEQKKLRDKIGYKGYDRRTCLFLSLFVEVGECLNEWRGFKCWSKNREPKDEQKLLDEFVDVGHFIFEIGLELFDEAQLPKEAKPAFFRPGMCDRDHINGMFLFFSKLTTDIMNWEHQTMACYQQMLNVWLSIGRCLGFTEYDITMAYLKKNMVNHKRQEEGY